LALRGAAAPATLAILCVVAPAAAGQPVAAEAPGERRIPLVVPLTLDGRLLGDIGVDVATSGGPALVDAPRLLALLGPRLGGATATRLAAALAGRDKAPLDSIAIEGVRLELDMASLTLKAEAAGTALARREIRLAGIEAPDPRSYDPQAPWATGVGITLFQTIGPERGGAAYAARPLNAIVEGYANVGGFEGLSLTFAADTQRTVRDIRWRDVALFHDRFDEAIRLGLGELTPRPAGFQGGGDLVGIGIERRYAEIRPFQNIRATGRRQIVIERPSEVEIFVNGISAGVRRLAAGPYDLDDFPLVEGNNNVQLVVRDPGGREEVLDFGVFRAGSLLGRGLVDFGGWAGWRTSGDLTRQGRPLATGFVQWGATSGLTLAATAQAGRGVTQLGTGAILGFGNTIIEADLAHSRNQRLAASGQALGIDLRQSAGLFRPDDVTLTASFEARSSRFSSIGQPNPLIREKWRTAAALTMLLPHGIGTNIGGNWSRGRTGERDSYGVTGSVFGALGRANLSLTASHENSSGRRRTRALLGLAMPFAGRINGSARFDALGRDREIQLSRFLGTGLRELGGSLQASRSADRDQIEGRLEFAGQRLGLEVAHRLVDPAASGLATVNESRWRLSTFVGVADGLIGVGRKAAEGFAVVRRHPTLKGSQLTLADGSRVLARSDGLGNLVVPVNRAYSDIRAKVEAEPLPLGYDIGSGVLRLFPGLAGGYAVTIGSDASLTVLGVFLGRSGEPLKLIAGELVNPKLPAPIPFFTNSAGRFAANKVAPGRYDIKVRDRVVGKMEVKAGDDSLVQMGRIALDLD
jgi:hypothetical protein